MTQMSQEAQDALWTAKSNTVGSPVYAPRPVLEALMDSGHIGRNLGLTRKGSIARERMVNAAQDKAFG